MKAINREMLNGYGHGVTALIVIATTEYNLVKNGCLDLKDLRNAHKYLVNNSAGKKAPDYTTFRQLVEKIRNLTHELEQDLHGARYYHNIAHRHTHLDRVHRNRRKNLISHKSKEHKSLVSRLG